MLDRKTIFLLFILLLLAFGCKKPPYEKAMKGQFSPGESIKIISSKCRDCHVHKNFDEKVHMEKMPSLYLKKKYREAKDCRACHYTDKNFSDRIWKGHDFFFHPRTVKPGDKK